MEAQYRWLLRNAYMIRIVPAHVPAASAGLVLMEYIGSPREDPDASGTELA